jgi:hypothetical protein
MKVNVLRSGGFAGMTTGWEIRVDEQPDPGRWESLVEACPWDRPEACAPDAAGGPGADRFVYEFQAGRRRTRLGESLVQGPWRELADSVRENGRRMPAAEVSPARR